MGLLCLVFDGQLWLSVGSKYVLHSSSSSAVCMRTSVTKHYIARV